MASDGQCVSCAFADEPLNNKDMVGRETEVEGNNRTFEHLNHKITGIYNKVGKGILDKIRLQDPQIEVNHPSKFGSDPFDG